MSDPAFSLSQGSRYPYDETAGPTRDWAHYAARGVLADLTDRRGVKHDLDAVDDDVREELVSTLADIIRTAHETYDVGEQEA